MILILPHWHLRTSDIRFAASWTRQARVEDLMKLSGWLPALKEAHARRFLDRPKPHHIKMCMTMTDEDAGVPWQGLLEGGFYDAVIRCVADEYFCGFSEEYLVSERGRQTQTLVSGLSPKVRESVNGSWP